MNKKFIWIYGANITLILLYQVYFGSSNRDMFGLIRALLIVLHFSINIVFSKNTKAEISKAFIYSAILTLLIGIPTCTLIHGK